MATKEEILHALEDVKDPELRRSLIELNMIREVKVERDVVYVEVALTTGGCPLKGRIEEDIRARLLQLPGVSKVLVKLDAMTEAERQTLMDNLQGRRETRSRLMAPDSRTQVIAVASGKGGVGKSTVTVNLACALMREGFEVGVLDADIYGFSVPLLLGVSGRPQVIDKAMVPLEVEGIQVMSIGFFVDERTPIIWRGPMLAGAVDQFLNDVLWGDLDYLLVDLPPGTGDVVLSLIQRLPRMKMLLVTTPQAASYQVAARAGHLAEKTNQEIVGIIENMSLFECPHCGEASEIFGGGGADILAHELGVPVIARIPLETGVREAGDEGRPIVLSRPESPAARAFLGAAREVAARMGASVPKA